MSAAQVGKRLPGSSTRCPSRNPSAVSPADMATTKDCGSDSSLIIDQPDQTDEPHRQGGTAFLHHRTGPCPCRIQSRSRAAAPCIGPPAVRDWCWYGPPLAGVSGIYRRLPASAPSHHPARRPGPSTPEFGQFNDCPAAPRRHRPHAAATTAPGQRRPIHRLARRHPSPILHPTTCPAPTGPHRPPWPGVDQRPGVLAGPQYTRHFPKGFSLPSRTPKIMPPPSTTPRPRPDGPTILRLPWPPTTCRRRFPCINLASRPAAKAPTLGAGPAACAGHHPWPTPTLFAQPASRLSQPYPGPYRRTQVVDTQDGHTVRAAPRAPSTHSSNPPACLFRSPRAPTGPAHLTPRKSAHRANLVRADWDVDPRDWGPGRARPASNHRGPAWPPTRARSCCATTVVATGRNLRAALSAAHPRPQGSRLALSVTPCPA